MFKQEEMRSIEPITSLKFVELCLFHVETIGLIEETNCETVSLKSCMKLITFWYSTL